MLYDRWALYTTALQETQFSVLPRERERVIRHCGLIAGMKDAFNESLSWPTSMVAKLACLLSLTSPQICFLSFFLSPPHLHLYLPFSPSPSSFSHSSSYSLSSLSLSLFVYQHPLRTLIRLSYKTFPLTQSHEPTATPFQFPHCPIFVSKGVLFSSTYTTT